MSLSGTSRQPTPKLDRTLGTVDLVLLNVTAVVSLRWLSIAAHMGPSSLTLWLVGLVVFFLPSALTVLELSSCFPNEGGIYVWSKAAFGDLHGFIVGWAYWVSNVVFLPSLLLFMAGVVLYAFGPAALKLADSPNYNNAFCLTTLWAVVFLNLVGLRRAKWLLNIGGVATWTVGALVLVGGVIAWHRFGAATPIYGASLVSNLTSLPALSSFATMVFAYSGLELAPILAEEIKNPKRAFARATFLACVFIALVYIVGTAALLVALPAQQINIISGVPQALAEVGRRIGISYFGVLGAVLLTLSQIGTLTAWLAGTARLPFLFGFDRYLPRAFGAVHPRFKSPYVALCCQGILTTLILLAATASSAVHEAFVLLIDMSIILVFVPLLYMFASLPVIRRKISPTRSDLTLIPGGTVACWIVAGAGIAVTLLGICVAMIPPETSHNRTLFALKVIGGCALLIAAGLPFYARGARSLTECRSC